MSLAFEITEADVASVLSAHNLATPEILHLAFDAALLESDRIEKAALWYLDMDDQTASALDEIENILIEEGILPENARKSFTAP